MINIGVSPLRISLIGGGTDFRSYFEKNTGGVISFTIDKYVYVITKRKYDKKIKLSYSLNENPKSVNSIKHNLIRNIFKYYNIKGDIEFVSLADIHSNGTGLGSSSAFTLASLNSLNLLLKKPVLNKKELADLACYIEIKKNKSPIGIQDQFACSYGGINFFNFKKNITRVRRLDFEVDELRYLNKVLLLYNTNIYRSANSILINHKENISKNKNLDYLKYLYDETLLLKENLLNKNLDYIIKSLNTSWYLKKKFNPETTNKIINNIIQKGFDNGAKGAKLLGAGKGGFVLFYVNSNKVKSFKKLMGEKNFLQYNFDFKGSHSQEIL